ncbi:hypothetical protein [Streptomyces neyagawaensis]|uniref:hypothetical protein n=1 Tax=Streptomyces neyagawaensis TaxID=42238 RepID=UPI00201CD33A|nr:hypothetical protein [Streptomyces neyagawaensis]MCL6737299.1 hypothetical protein [Streptomyces neyagawaensis]MDE1681745.1 hypothetical protein [Streptomyces neyagawaensis]
MSRKPELRGRAARLARLLPAGSGRAARTPFVLLVVVLLGGGLIGLLVLNSALSEGSFQLDDLQDDVKSYTDEEQALQRDVDAYSAPEALQRRARELGMVPGGDPAFLEPDGRVKGVPSPAAPQSPASLPLVLAPEALAPASAGGPAPTPTPTPSPSDSPAPPPAGPPGAAPGVGATPGPGPETVRGAAPGAVRGAAPDSAPGAVPTPTGPSARSAPLTTNPGR